MTGNRLDHDAMVALAARWLRRLRCRVVLTEPRTVTDTSEIPDAIGWRDTLSIVVECKTDRGDFLRDANKPFRRQPENGLGDWRFYMAPEGMIAPSECPSGWGLIAIDNHGKVAHTTGVPPNTRWHKDHPFPVNNKHAEVALLVSQLSR